MESPEGGFELIRGMTSNHCGGSGNNDSNPNIPCLRINWTNQLVNLASHYPNATQFCTNGRNSIEVNGGLNETNFVINSSNGEDKCDKNQTELLEDFVVKFKAGDELYEVLFTGATLAVPKK
jgi:hypothetical protein